MEVKNQAEKAKDTLGRFKLDIRKTFFTERVVKHWNRLPSRRPIPGNIQGGQQLDRKPAIASSLLGCIRRTAEASRGRRSGDPPPLLSTGETHLEYWVLFWALQYMDLLEQIQCIATKIINDLLILSYEERLSKLELFDLEKTRLRGDFINVFKDLMVGPFLVEPSERTRGNGQKLKYKQFCSNIRKKFLTVRVIKHWNSFAQRDVEFPVSDIFKTRLDAVPCNLSSLTLLKAGGLH
ncbi:hypothetical protein QYF61_009965 [Mycteria americana]|uniref:Uncharacterized protein n=1 Tax=Mycteria americana TaxID=33587 RepID=A0AAN7NM60_MYCAM|nr:hypothetical protein QYF61_009965 [Mycteria americana]